MTAMADLSKVVEGLAARSAATEFPRLPGEVNRRWVAVATMPADADDPITRALDLTHDALSALRVATNASIPPFSIERVWPLYLIAYSDGAGNVDVRNVTLVEHGRFGPLAAADEGRLQQATQFLLHRWRRSPIETYQDFAHAARTSLWQDGDYTKAVTSSAVACEVLLKHAAWMLSFEAQAAEFDPAPDAATTGLGLLKPRQLIGQVLTKRLGGDWSSNDESKPVGAWRHHVAQLRTRVLHRGHRATADEAGLAVQAMKALEQHVCDRLTGKGTTYPRTAITLLGPAGLDRRSALEAVSAALDDAGFVAEDWLLDNVTYLDNTLDDTGVD